MFDPRISIFSVCVQCIQDQKYSCGGLHEGFQTSPMGHRVGRVCTTSALIYGGRGTENPLYAHNVIIKFCETKRPRKFLPITWYYALRLYVRLGSALSALTSVARPYNLIICGTARLSPGLSVCSVEIPQAPILINAHLYPDILIKYRTHRSPACGARVVHISLQSALDSAET